MPYPSASTQLAPRSTGRLMTLKQRRQVLKLPLTSWIPSGAFCNVVV